MPLYIVIQNVINQLFPKQLAAKHSSKTCIKVERMYNIIFITMAKQPTDYSDLKQQQSFKVLPNSATVFCRNTKVYDVGFITCQRFFWQLFLINCITIPCQNCYLMTTIYQRIGHLLNRGSGITAVDRINTTRIFLSLSSFTMLIVVHSRRISAGILST